jgi:hypothetical protein
MFPMQLEELKLHKDTFLSNLLTLMKGFGTDPYLQGIAAALTIKGIQEEGVIATIKHFVGNEQEHFRRGLEWGLPHALSANIDDRVSIDVFHLNTSELVTGNLFLHNTNSNMIDTT